MYIDEAIILQGGMCAGGVVRIGDTVRRRMTSRSPYIHALLRLLQQRGFDGAPRFLGIDSEGREILSYIEGWVPHEAVDWNDDRLAVFARLTRQLHDATAGTELAGDSEVACHNDIAPWNTVLVEGCPRAFIDFDDAAPGCRLDDLAYILWVYLGIGPNADPVSTGERARGILEAYGRDMLGEEVGPRLLICLQRQQERVLQGWKARLSDQPNHPVSLSAKVAELRSDQEWLARHWQRIAEPLDR